MANRSPSRRRQRRIRISVAVAMLVFAAAVAIPALALQTPTLLSIAVVGVFLCGASAARIVHSELVMNRRRYAAERTEIAVDYRRLAVKQSRENTAFADSMTDRLAQRDAVITELHSTVQQVETRATAAEQRAGVAEQRAVVSEQRAVDEGRRADHATEALIELQRDIEADESALIEELSGGNLETVDLLEWEEKVIALGAHSGRLPKHA